MKGAEWKVAGEPSHSVGEMTRAWPRGDVGDGERRGWLPDPRSVLAGVALVGLRSGSVQSRGRGLRT